MKAKLDTYGQLTLRNRGYIDEKLQVKISDTRILIAGCGVGSAVAEAALRIGFTKFTLCDADTVEAHNLNRQDYTSADLGKPKVEALARRLHAIYPEAQVNAVNSWMTPQNSEELIRSCDFVFDTIDLLSLEGILALHDTAAKLDKPLVSGFSAGFGAAALYFPPGGVCTMRSLLGYGPLESVSNDSYAARFEPFLETLATNLDPTVARNLARTFELMEDGKPCPAPHVSVGASALAGLMVNAAVRSIAGQPLRAAPELVYVNIAQAWATQGINLTVSKIKKSA